MIIALSVNDHITNDTNAISILLVIMKIKDSNDHDENYYRITSGRVVSTDVSVT